MSDPFATVQPGQRVEQSARFHNAVGSVVRALLQSGAFWALVGGKPGDEAELPCVKVNVRNISTLLAPEFGVLRTDVSMFDPAVAVDSWRNVVIDGNRPQAASTILIPQAPIRPDEIGVCAIQGVTWAMVNVTATGHGFAKPTTSVERLQSSTAGPAKILWKEAGTGVKKALILLLGTECECCCDQGGGTGGCNSLCQSNADCMRIVVLDPDGFPLTLYVPRTTPAPACGWQGQYGSFGNPVPGSRYTAIVQIGSGGQNGTNFVLVNFYSPETGAFVGGIESQACTDYLGAGDFPLRDPQIQYGNAGQSRILSVTPAPGQCGQQGGGGLGGGLKTGATSGGDCGCGGSTPTKAASGAGLELFNKQGTGLLNYAEKIAKDTFDAEFALVALTGTSTPATLAANQNDYAPTLAARLRLSTDGGGARTITGLAGGVSGYRVVIKNYGSQTINFTHLDGASAAANQFFNPGALTYVLVAGATIEYQYCGAESRWEQV